MDLQETWSMLVQDTGDSMTAVAIGIAKLGDPAVVLGAAKSGGGFVASGRAPSVAAGRLSYTHGLKVSVPPSHFSVLQCSRQQLRRADHQVMFLPDQKFCVTHTCIAEEG